MFDYGSSFGVTFDPLIMVSCLEPLEFALVALVDQNGDTDYFEGVRDALLAAAEGAHPC
jgi:hypothetical protein